MPDHEIFKEPNPEDCFYGCKTMHDFMRLTDEMVHTIIGLEEELVRWRQALIAICAEQRPLVRLPAATWRSPTATLVKVFR